ncbi:hypothetical protein CGRA01v4_00543 [Colletotrichum graminicola]|nr:hypothetical protein CGRA01v4_00543 [Colletotrichum graminicola]
MTALESRRPARSLAGFCICQWPPRVPRTTRIRVHFGRRGPVSRRIFRATSVVGPPIQNNSTLTEVRSRVVWGHMEVLEKKNLPNSVSIFSFVSLLYKNCSSARQNLFYTTSRHHTLALIDGRNALPPSRLVRARDVPKASIQALREGARS